MHACRKSERVLIGLQLATKAASNMIGRAAGLAEKRKKK